MRFMDKPTTADTTECSKQKTLPYYMRDTHFDTKHTWS